MVKKEKLHVIYTELDCLLDTRLGTLALISDELVNSAIQNNYVTRIEENFPPLDKNTFIELYDTRDKDILKISPMTMCCEFIKDLSISILRETTEGPIATGVEIVINTYPYKLNDYEARDLLTSFAILTGQFINIRLMYSSMEELTPIYCKENFDSMFIYQYDKWFDIHAIKNNFKNVNVTKLMLYGPKIYFNRKPTFEEKRKLEKNKLNTFSLVEEMASAVIDLTLLDISIFSVDITKYVENI